MSQPQTKRLAPERKTEIAAGCSKDVDILSEVENSLSKNALVPKSWNI